MGSLFSPRIWREEILFGCHFFIFISKSVRRRKTTSTMPSSQSPLFNTLPGHITTSFILPYVTSSDWLNFRAASRACYISVHGSGDDVWQFVCPTCQATKSPTIPGCASGNAENVVILSTTPDGNENLCEKLWKLALVRDYQFEDTDDGHDELLYKSLHSPIEPVSDAFLSTENLFTASNLFFSWMHWRKLETRVISAR
jgi:hypothetical protein